MSVEDARAFVTQLREDEDLVRAVSEAYIEMLVRIAGEQGFTVSTEELTEAFRAKQEEANLSEESLEDVAGGAPPKPSTRGPDEEDEYPETISPHPGDDQPLG